MISYLSILLCAVAPVVADRASHSVTFTACATEIKKGAIVEFGFVGPNSDRAYEAMFVTDAPLEDIARAFDEAGVPRGKCVSSEACRFWPSGNYVSIEPDLSQFIAVNEKEKDKHLPRLILTSGKRGAGGELLAASMMPAALLSFYALDQSILLFDDNADQSVAYGRYLCAKQLTPGERFTFRISWNGVEGTKCTRLNLKPGKLHASIAALKEEKGILDAMPIFDDNLTVSEARSAAAALSLIDSRSIKINGYADGQLFYRAFLPDALWRDRAKRLTQPVEAHLGASNVVFTVIDEDWSVEGLDPKLTPHEEPLEKLATIFKGDTCLIYASSSDKLARIYALVAQMPKSIRNWYVFCD